MPTESVSRIPKSLGEIRRTEPLRASALSAAASCLLKVALDGEPRHRPLLPPPPEARLGTLIHRAIASPRPTRKALEDLRRRLLEGGELVQSSATESGEIELRDALGVARLLARIGTRQKPRRESRSERTGVEQPSTERFSERSIVSRDGELHGRVDLLEVFRDGSVRITDFKSGSIHTDSGDPKPEWLTQLRAYGYLVTEEGIGVSPKLRLVGPDGVWEGEFYEEDRREVERTLYSIVDRIPKERSIEASDLASFGPACRYCGHRAVCGTYRTAAPKAWQDGTTFPLPTDTWGRILETSDEPAGTVRVRLEDAAGRPVSVLGVPARLVGTFGEGARAWFFAVRGVRTEKTDRHFQNFRIKAARFENSAHGALVLVALPSGPIEK